MLARRRRTTARDGGRRLSDAGFFPALGPTMPPTLPATDGRALAPADHHGLIAQVVETVADALLLIDAHCRVTFANAAAERLLGVPRAELIGLSWRHPPWRCLRLDGGAIPEDEKSYNRALDHGEPTIGLERLVVRADGSRVMVRGSTVPLRDASGDVVGLAASFTDITQRVRAELELRQREERFRALVENSFDATALLNADGVVEYVTPDPMARMLGYRPDEFIGRVGFEFVHADDRPALLRQFTEFLSDPDRPASVLCRVRHRDGSWRHIETVARNRLDDPAVGAIVAHFHDATERVQAESALRASEERYRILFERNLAGVFRSRLDGTLLDCNDSFARAFGFPNREAMLGQNTHAFDRSSEDRQRFEAALTRHGSLTNYESAMRRRDGSPLWLLENVTLRADPDGPVQEGTAVDITDRKRADEQLRQAHKMEALGQLAGGVAHDFNNLLTGILGNLAMALPQLTESHPARELLTNSETAAWRAAELTGQLLGFARRNTVRLQPLGLARSVADTVGLLRRTVDPRITVEVVAAPDLWPVMADPTQMNQLVLNLCLNARDAMPDGGRLTLAMANVVLGPSDAGRHVEARTGEYVRLRVADTGCGMTDEVRAHMYEPFFTTKEVGKGTGLGLAVVFAAVKRHDGWIECDTAPGRGTCFDVYLPRTGLRGSVHAKPDAPPEGGHETVLVADDEPLVRGLAQATLTQFGYTVLLAEDGVAAVESYRQHAGKISLVVLDMTMPRLSGRDTFLQLRQLDPAVRVIFSSGYSADSLSSDEAAGASGFVSKPYRPRDLARAVREALDRS
jgi:PAS domain S-box-containing protein